MNAAEPCDATIVSVQVGLPRSLTFEESDVPTKSWTTGFLKERIDGPVWLGSLNLAGDGQADLVHHGGENKAVCVYSADHFPFWRSELSELDFQVGAFGENFTITGLTERDVCIGDTWEIGEALVQVSQPRQPCWKLARRWNVKDLALRVQQTGRTGWYFRVLREGFVASGMPLLLVERPHAEWTVDKANHIMHHDKTNIDETARLAALAELSFNWRESLNKRIHQHLQAPDQTRLYGND